MLVPPPLVVDMEVEGDPTVHGDDSQWLQSPLRKTPGRGSGGPAGAAKGGAAGVGGMLSAKDKAATAAAIGGDVEQGAGSGAEGASDDSGDGDGMVDQVIEEGEGEEEGGISVGPEHQADLPDWRARPQQLQKQMPMGGAQEGVQHAQQRAADLAKAGVPGPNEEEVVQQVAQVRGNVLRLGGLHWA
jgi:hypothetical protein